MEHMWNIKMNNSELKYIYVVADKQEETVRESNENDSWDRGDTSATWDFKRLSGTKGDEAVPVTFTPIEGQTYFVLLAIYSSGDSFGHDESCYVEYFDIFENSTDANNAERELLATQRNDNVEFTNHRGTKVKVYNPWNGYFNSLNDIRVEYLTYYEV
jgi:hypothetical protein